MHWYRNIWESVCQGNSWFWNVIAFEILVIFTGATYVFVWAVDRLRTKMKTKRKQTKWAQKKKVFLMGISCQNMRIVRVWHQFILNIINRVELVSLFILSTTLSHSLTPHPSIYTEKCVKYKMSQIIWNIWQNEYHWMPFACHIEKDSYTNTHRKSEEDRERINMNYIQINVCMLSFFLRKCKWLTWTCKNCLRNNQNLSDDNLYILNSLEPKLALSIRHQVKIELSANTKADQCEILDGMKEGTIRIHNHWTGFIKRIKNSFIICFIIDWIWKMISWQICDVHMLNMIWFIKFFSFWAENKNMSFFRNMYSIYTKKQKIQLKRIIESADIKFKTINLSTVSHYFGRVDQKSKYERNRVRKREKATKKNI